QTSSDAQTAVALVTGAGGGIGAEICRKLAARGLRVVACDIDAGKLQALAGELGPGHTAMSFDVSDESEVQQAFDAVEAEHGPVAVVVCAAGLLLFQENGERPLIRDTSLSVWQRSLAVNATGVFLCAR